VIAPHLIFAHLLADYILQTNWLAERKGQFVVREIHSWDGLLLHGFMVWLVALAVLPAYINDLWPYLTLLAIVHTIQDGAKVIISNRFNIHPFYPYVLDQIGHLITIFIFQALVADLLVPAPSMTEISLMILGSSLVAVTRFYEVTWWANWMDMFSYFRQWWLWSYAERIVMFLLSAANLWLLAPLAVLPRIFAAQRRGEPIWQQKRGMLELLLGIAFSVILGFAL
jgi:hypothetical protein